MNNPSEYDALNFDGLEQRGNYRTIAYREDILHALDKKDAAAIIYNIVYRWLTNVRKAEVQKEIERRKKAGLPPMTAEEVENMMWVYMSYNDFVYESGGALGYNTVIRTLDYLLNTKKVLRQRENHDPRYSDYEYTIDKDVARKILADLPLFPAYTPKGSKGKRALDKSSTQMGTENPSNDGQENCTQMGTPGNDSTHLGTSYTQMGTGATQMGTTLYPNGGTSQNLTYNSHNNITEEDIVPDVSQSVDAAHAPVGDAHTHASFSFDQLIEAIQHAPAEKKQLLLQVLQSEQMSTPGVQNSQTRVDNSAQGNDPQPVERTVPDGNAPNPGGDTDGSQECSASEQHPIANTEPAQAEHPTQQSFLPDQAPSGNGRGKQGSTRKKGGTVPAGPPQMPSDDAPWNGETITQICEARQGRRYPNGAKDPRARVRDKEVKSSQAVAEMHDLWTGNTGTNRDYLIKLMNQLETRHDNWWLETNGHVMPHQLVDKDRIHAMHDELQRIEAKKQSDGRVISFQGRQSANQASERPSPLASPEARQRNKERLRQKIAAQG